MPQVIEIDVEMAVDLRAAGEPPTILSRRSTTARSSSAAATIVEDQQLPSARGDRGGDLLPICSAGFALHRIGQSSECGSPASRSTECWTTRELRSSARASVERPLLDVGRPFGQRHVRSAG